MLVKIQFYKTLVFVKGKKNIFFNKTFLPLLSNTNHPVQVLSWYIYLSWLSTTLGCSKSYLKSAIVGYKNPLKPRKACWFHLVLYRT